MSSQNPFGANPFDLSNSCFDQGSDGRGPSRTSLSPELIFYPDLPVADETTSGGPGQMQPRGYNQQRMASNGWQKFAQRRVQHQTQPFIQYNTHNPFQPPLQGNLNFGVASRLRRQDALQATNVAEHPTLCYHSGRFVTRVRALLGENSDAFFLFHAALLNWRNGLITANVLMDRMRVILAGHPNILAGLISFLRYPYQAAVGHQDSFQLLSIFPGPTGQLLSAQLASTASGPDVSSPMANRDHAGEAPRGLSRQNLPVWIDYTTFQTDYQGQNVDYGSCEPFRHHYPPLAQPERIHSAAGGLGRVGTPRGPSQDKNDQNSSDSDPSFVPDSCSARPCGTPRTLSPRHLPSTEPRPAWRPGMYMPVNPRPRNCKSGTGTGPFRCPLCLEHFSSPGAVRLHFLGRSRRGRKEGVGCSWVYGWPDVRWNDHPTCQPGNGIPRPSRRTRRAAARRERVAEDWIIETPGEAPGRRYNTRGAGAKKKAEAEAKADEIALYDDEEFQFEDQQAINVQEEETEDDEDDDEDEEEIPEGVVVPFAHRRKLPLKCPRHLPLPAKRKQKKNKNGKASKDKVTKRKTLAKKAPRKREE